MTEVGINELRRHLSRYLDRVRGGEEITVTRRGTAVARIVPVVQPRPYAHLVAEGAIEQSAVSNRTRPAKRVATQGSVAELVRDQRR